MKRIIFTLTFICMAIMANAQVTWIIKAGPGLAQTMEIPVFSNGNSRIDMSGDIGLAIGAEACIPLKRHSRWVFSPSLNANIGLGITNSKSGSSLTALYSGLLFGYRARIGNGSSLVAQAGPALGAKIGGAVWNVYDAQNGTQYDPSISGRFMFAPMVELNWEIKHFVISMLGYYDVIQIKSSVNNVDGYYGHMEHCFHGSLSFGYKF